MCIRMHTAGITRNMDVLWKNISEINRKQCTLHRFVFPMKSLSILYMAFLHNGFAQTSLSSPEEVSGTPHNWATRG